ncbi:MAG: transposase [Phycisphaeraceae bacterium]|nr:transposase [Phycisphaerae bacterium]MBX3393404.1 transposase [Phycisphaeraceae bacterium]
MPDNIVILRPPPYSPELNPVETLWGYMRSHYLSNRAYDGHDHLVQAAGDAYRALTPDMLKSVCRGDYAGRAS